MTLADLAGYRVKVREPVCGTYRVYRVCGMPPPSSGGITVLQMLGMLEPYDIGGDGSGVVLERALHQRGRAARLRRSRRRTSPIPDFVRAAGGPCSTATTCARARV